MMLLGKTKIWLYILKAQKKSGQTNLFLDDKTEYAHLC